MTKTWLGAAAWNRKEAHAGDRLPYAKLADANGGRSPSVRT